MFRLAGSLLAVLAFFSIAGGHWAVLQSVAWAQMVRDFSQQEPLVVALQKTFSGAFPCSLCEQITEGRQREDRELPARAAAAAKAEILLAEPALAAAPPPASVFRYPPPADAAFAARAEPPPGRVPIRSSVLLS